MTSFEELAAASFKIIAAVGDARSCYLEAIHAAKNGDYEGAQARLDEGQKMFRTGHAAHTELVQREAGGDPVDMTLMITHAEDQLMSAEAFGILADEFIDVYRRLDGME